PCGHRRQGSLTECGFTTFDPDTFGVGIMFVHTGHSLLRSTFVHPGLRLSAYPGLFTFNSYPPCPPCPSGSGSGSGPAVPAWVWVALFTLKNYDNLIYARSRVLK